MGVVSGPGEVGLISLEEQNKGQGGPLVDSEAEVTIMKVLPKASAVSMGNSHQLEHQ